MSDFVCKWNTSCIDIPCILIRAINSAAVERVVEVERRDRPALSAVNHASCLFRQTSSSARASLGIHLSWPSTAISPTAPLARLAFHSYSATQLPRIVCGSIQYSVATTSKRPHPLAHVSGSSPHGARPVCALRVFPFQRYVLGHLQYLFHSPGSRGCQFWRVPFTR